MNIENHFTIYNFGFSILWKCFYQKYLYIKLTLTRTLKEARIFCYDINGKIACYVVILLFHRMNVSRIYVKACWNWLWNLEITLILHEKSPTSTFVICFFKLDNIREKIFKVRKIQPKIYIKPFIAEHSAIFWSVLGVFRLIKKSHWGIQIHLSKVIQFLLMYFTHDFQLCLDFGMQNDFMSHYKISNITPYGKFAHLCCVKFLCFKIITNNGNKIENWITFPNLYEYLAHINALQ